MRANIGCGQTPNAGWLNFDNSPSVIIANTPIVFYLMSLAGLINQAQKQFICTIKKQY